jgi:hypothetical protein
MNMRMKGQQRRTMQEIITLARWFNLLQSLGASGKKATFYINYVMDNPVSQTTLQKYSCIAEAKAIKDAN